MVWCPIGQKVTHVDRRNVFTRANEDKVSNGSLKGGEVLELLNEEDKKKMRL
jgi:hypothetical protein